MLYQTILVPYDRSPHAQDALVEAARFAKEDPGVSLRIIAIIDTEQLAEEKLNAQDPDDPSPRYTRTDVDALYETVISEANVGVHQSIGTLLDGLQNEIVIQLLEETVPGEQIIEYSKEHSCDLIIMGSRGLGTLESLLGSVSSKVLQDSDIPVMVVK